MANKLQKGWKEYAVKLAQNIQYTGINNKAHYAKLFIAAMDVKK